MNHSLQEKTSLDGIMYIVLRDAVTNEIKEYHEIHNIVCDRGKNVIAARLNGETTYTGIINYLAVGTGAASPASTDTQLVTELARTTVSSNSRVNNIATISFFFNSASGNGTLTEAGAYIDGTGSPNSGQLFDHVSLPSIVKTSADTLTITLVGTVL